MIANTTAPLSLYNANLEFALRISALLQKNRQRWLALGASGSKQSVDEARRKVEETSGSTDWTAWRNLPGDAFTAWREQCKAVLAEQGGMLPFATSFDEFEKQFRNLAATTAEAVKAIPVTQKGRS